MKTVWGEQLNPNSVLQEYPRPQLVRESYENLNGLWDIAITKTDAKPDAWDGKILVPFSPEAELSGVGKALQPGQFLWYRRTLTSATGSMSWNTSAATPRFHLTSRRLSTQETTN